ncbi:MAG: DUF4340 domain-containing protein [Deltaproteobacteria bacterium]|nr:DUF4340 domain-containing protein [Deltaproteobacteria bacterium]
MRTRWTLILLAAVAALGAYIYFVESEGPTTSELSERKENVFARFDRDSVDRISLTREGKTVDLEKKDGKWRVVRPVRARADDGAVDGLLSAIEFSSRDRTINAKGARKRSEFGLKAPRVRGSFRSRGTVHRFQVGAEDSTGEGIYLAVDDEPAVYVVGKDFYDSVAKELSDLRDKRVAEVRLSKVKSLAIRGGERDVRLRKSSGGWNLEAPFTGRASRSKVEDVLRAVENLRAERFVADGARDLGSYGLDPAWRTLRLEIEGGSPVTLGIGAPCGDEGAQESSDSGKRHVTLEGSRSVVCAASGLYASISRDPAELRDKRLVSTRDEDVAAVVLEGRGSKVRIKRHEGGFRLVEPQEAPADTDAVKRLLSELRSLEATEFLPAGDLGARGLDPAGITVTVERDDGGGKEVVRLGSRDGETAFARRGDEEQVLRIPARALELAAVDALRFRPRRIVNDDVLDAVAMRAEAGGVRQELKKTEGVWRLERPIALRADSLTTRDVARRVAELTAERWVADRDDGSHGLSTPRLRLWVKFEGQGDEEEPEEDEADGGELPARPTARLREYTLVVGSATDGGYFARLEGPGGGDAVFVVAASVVEDAERPLADRNLFQIDETDIARMTVERVAGRVELTRSGEGWKKGSAEMPRDEITPLLDKLASVRAMKAVGFGAAPANAALGSPAIRVSIHRAEHEEGEPDDVTIAIGATSGAGADAGYYARRADVDATFIIPKEIVDTLLGLF